jgi:hypothetical protein
MTGFLKWTGHQTAAITGFAAFMIGCLLVLAVEPLEWIDLDRPLAPWVLLAGFAVAISAGVGLCVFVRCPRCQVRIIWHAVSKDPHPHGLDGLFLSAKCPFCGFPGATPAAAASLPPVSAGSTENHSSAADSSTVTSLEGPVERIDGKLTLLIPLDAGGDQFIQCTRGISEVQGGELKIVIQEWLAGMLRIEDGDLVTIDNANRKFNIRAVNARPIH